MQERGRRDDLLDGVCAYVLEHSLAALSLRPLAAALGTSDRMLIYHFGSRERLLSAVLDALGSQLREMLGGVLPSTSVTPDVALAALVTAMRSPDAEPIMRVWLEMCGLAARSIEPFASEAKRVTQSWVAWLAPRLVVGHDEPVATAEAVLAAADGVTLLELITGESSGRASRLLRIDAG